jgi:hypothetical protein
MKIANRSRYRSHRACNYGNRVGHPIGVISHICQSRSSAIWDILGENVRTFHTSDEDVLAVNKVGDNPLKRRS